MTFLSKAVLKLSGWKIANDPPPEIFEKCVIICAPHTSNWDYPIALAIMSQLGIKAKYAIKKELMGFPLGPILRSLGGMAIDRTPHIKGVKRESTVKAIANLFDKNDQLCMMIAAEGSRSIREQWKTGFYYIALEAKVPICLGYLNYATKEGGFDKVIYPSGDLDKDMQIIMDFYQGIVAKKPQNFSLDSRFGPSIKEN
jgi:1-acyl-sn-glycerol-3-phosphate acyltransferase